MLVEQRDYKLYVIINYPDDEKQAEHIDMTYGNVKQVMTQIMDRETDATSFVFTVSRA